MTTPDDKLPDVWVSRHGGEPVALLAELDEARARIADLEAELRISDEKLDDQTGLLLGERESRKKAEAELAAELAWRGSSTPEDIARRFHEAYEHFAPQFGYSTRPESRKAWDELPPNLRDLMIAVVRAVLIEQPTAERGRREAAEALLTDALNGPLAYSSHGVVKGIFDHFARYKD